MMKCEIKQSGGLGLIHVRYEQQIDLEVSVGLVMGLAGPVQKVQLSNHPLFCLPTDTRVVTCSGKRSWSIAYV